MEFDIQAHLVGMESRIRADISAVSSAAQREVDSVKVTVVETRAVADSAIIAQTEVAGRVKNLEEKMSWIGGGFGLSIVGAVGFIWHVITGHKS